MLQIFVKKKGRKSILGYKLPPLSYQGRTHLAKGLFKSQLVSVIEISPYSKLLGFQFICLSNFYV